MSEDHKKILKQQLWNIADTLRGKMNADEFRDYILGFIFYKYLSEKMEIFANEILKQDKVKFREITLAMPDFEDYLKAIKEEALEKLGYFLKPEELFSEIAVRGKGENHENDQFDEEKTGFILEDVQKILLNIQLSTMGTDSEEDFDNLFEDMDLNSTKLGKTPEARNTIIAKVLTHLDKIDFKLENTELDVLGDAYEYLIGQKAFDKLVKEEKLSSEKTEKLIEDYLFAEKIPLRDEVLELLEGEKPSLLQRKKLGDRILSRITDFVETFINGMTGN